jgi:hypothetical protein
LSFLPADLESLAHRLRTLGYPSGGRTPRFNIDGVLTSDVLDFDQPSSGYVELFRNGIIEAAAADITYVFPTDSAKRPYFRTQYEDYLRQSVPEYAACQQSLGIAPPIWVFVSLTGVKGVGISQRFGHPAAPINRDVLYLPEVEIAEFPVDGLRLLRPVFDMIWNAAGHRKSESFNAKDEFVSR